MLAWHYKPHVAVRSMTRLGLQLPLYILVGDLLNLLQLSSLQFDTLYPSLFEPPVQVYLEWLEREEALMMEPALHCVAALWSPNTAIVDSHRCRVLDRLCDAWMRACASIWREGLQKTCCLCWGRL